MLSAVRAASTVPASPVGGCKKCITGSATPKNIKPMPIPVEKAWHTMEYRQTQAMNDQGLI